MQNVIIPQSLEQRVSWKTTLDAIVLTAGVNNTFTVQLTPVVTDATPGVIGASFYRYIVSSLCNDSKKLMASPSTVEIPPESKSISITINPPTRVPRGYYNFQLILEDAEHNPVDMYETYMVIDKSIEPLPDNPHMSLASVRAQFADLSFEDNKLLDSQEIGTWDICDAVKRAIEQWNNTAPRLSVYSGHDFPYPEILRRGVMYMLLQTLIALLQRNQMQYSAGQTTVNLEQRVAAYQQLKAEYMQMWVGGLNQAKNEENLEDFNQSIGYR